MMKLKYYMRGMGVGIILTALILAISNKPKELTDEEIIQRASKLGMVMKEDSSNLDKLIDVIKPSAVATPTVAPIAEPTAEPTAIPTELPQITVTPAHDSDASVTEIPEEIKTPEKITFKILSGMTSEKVAELLQESGLIDDAEDFNMYVVRQGKAGVIKTGTYTIPADSDYDEIIKIITKSK